MSERVIVDWSDVDRLIEEERARPTPFEPILLSQIRHAVEATVSLVEQAGLRVGPATVIVCNELGIPDAREREVIRNGVARRLLRDAEKSHPQRTPLSAPEQSGQWGSRGEREADETALRSTGGDPA